MFAYMDMTKKETAKNDKLARLFPVDALRGFIIILMALDHANLFVAHKHPSGELWGGFFPNYTDSLTFLTRWVTHPTAPGFFFLMGVGMLFFARTRQREGWHKWRVFQHFIIRGAFLIVLQLLVVDWAWGISPSVWQRSAYFGVLFALGGCMMICSLLLWLKPQYLILITFILFIGTELLTPDPSQWRQAFGLPLRLLLIPGESLGYWINYPILPWLELATFGLVFGYWLIDNPRKAYERALKLGFVFIAVFLIIRSLDGFGNIRPRMGDTWIDFLNMVKYPPSMTFTLMSMGLILILLWIFSKLKGSGIHIFHPLMVFGQVPLFFYTTHLFLFAFLGLLFTPRGTIIPMMFPYWILGLLILYPLCLWFRKIKHHQSNNSILRFI